MQWCFEPFRLDLEHACLWQGGQRLMLRPKTFDLLVYLVKHAGELVSKEALLEAVWPDTAVAEGVLTTSVGELRKVLQETVQHPQFIATVHRRGYRFIAPVAAIEQPYTSPAISDYPSQGRVPPRPVLVDRAAELLQLQQWWRTASQGQRQIGFVAGEAGIGKTTLVDAFLSQRGAQERLWIGRGQCIDHYGAGEPYLPLLEALGQMANAVDGTRVIEVLRQHAPSWLSQLPALVSPHDFQMLQQQALGARRERMLRELAEAVEILTQMRPMILLLEDLHWGDVSTLDWLAYVARRRPAARLLCLGTYRPVDAVVRDHPIRAITRELRVHGQCQELMLTYLSEAGVAAYLAQRFGQTTPSNDLIEFLYRRTSGNPLFLVTVVDEILRHGPPQGAATWEHLPATPEAMVVNIPESLRLLIDQQFARLRPEEQVCLEAASIAGREFSAAAVAAGLGTAVEEVEVRCATLARRGQFVQAYGSDVWPDGTVAERYGFIHDLYHEFLYEQVPASRRARWHQQIGGRLEVGYGARSREMAAGLAVHFVRGRQHAKALQYLQYAGENAMQRHAHQEAILHLTQALALLPTLPDTPARTQQELMLRQRLGVPLVAIKGYATPEVEQTYSRAYTLCHQVGDVHQMRAVLLGLWRVYSMRGALKTAREVAAQLLDLAQHSKDLFELVEAHRAMGVVLSWLGDLTAACTHLEQGAALYDRQQHAPRAYHSGPDVGVSCLSMGAIPLWMLGYPDRAAARSEQAIALAQELNHPFSLAFALVNAARLYYFRREWQTVQERAEAVQKLAAEHDFAFWQAVATRWQGVVLAAQGQSENGIALICQGHMAYQANGTTTGEPYYRLLLAEAYSHAGQTERGMQVMCEALADFAKAEDRLYEAEVYRLKGKVLLACGTTPLSEVEACFRQALAAARRQKAKSLELRAAMSLVQLGQQGKAHDALADIYHRFNEGFDTADLLEAKELLEELSVSPKSHDASIML